MNHLTETDIHALYQRHVLKSDDYMQRDMAELQASGILDKYDPRGKDAPRVFSVLDFKEWVQKYNIRPERALITCPSDPEIAFLPPPENVTYAEYDGTAQYDLHQMSLEYKAYDFILCSHTLEHVYDPYACVRTLWGHLRPGGYIFMSVPTINIPHNTPVHFSHFFPSGLACMLTKVGFTVREVGHWGNQEYLARMFETLSWPDIYSLSSLKNDANRTCQCWILAQKSE